MPAAAYAPHVPHVHSCSARCCPPTAPSGAVAPNVTVSVNHDHVSAGVSAGVTGVSAGVAAGVQGLARGYAQDAEFSRMGREGAAKLPGTVMRAFGRHVAEDHLGLGNIYRM